ncbi:hypothetical protein [Pseudaestuariivita atlantica]|uniref:4Fe-4S ferredoxin-type domain-containing protein n=1 Tax=Pseudaestuariivita atlantica TaxID=1317121 RepID=A0A0L1JKL6_9RHOB|nr:hypothetical protein [Pseudaestuariivita atlantica]KNG92296.1 hypothetical protein ATO11_18225 [Pseudaestuariivita atlantica]
MEPVAAIRPPLTADTGVDLAGAAARHGLIHMGAFHRDTEEGAQTLALVGTGPGFWAVFTASPEYRDGHADPVDRWSRRVIGELAVTTGATDTAFPFGGPPYAPFLRWAEATGAAWQSPVGMLVHAEAGLMISYRGALIYDGHLPLGAAREKPCTTCDAPCVSACPVDALSAETGYDVAACHAYLDTEGGLDCLAHGCKARRACPVSRAFGRPPEQSALHMAAFHPR